MATGCPAALTLEASLLHIPNNSKNLKKAMLMTKYTYSTEILATAVSGAVVDGVDHNGETAIMKASLYGHVSTVRALLDMGASVNAVDHWKNTALMFAASAGRAMVVDLLLDRGADLHSRDYNNRTALMKAAWGGQVETVGILLQRGAAIEDNNNGKCQDLSMGSGWTPLMLAARNGHTKTVCLLIDMGAAIDAKSIHYDGCTALMLAVQEGHVNTTILLLNRGAAFETKDIRGNTALAWALDCGDPIQKQTIVYFLLNKGARGADYMYDSDVRALWRFALVMDELSCLPPGAGHKSFPGGGRFRHGEMIYNEMTSPSVL